MSNIPLDVLTKPFLPFFFHSIHILLNRHISVFAVFTFMSFITLLCRKDSVSSLVTNYYDWHCLVALLMCLHRVSVTRNYKVFQVIKCIELIWSKTLRSTISTPSVTVLLLISIISIKSGLTHHNTFYNVCQHITAVLKLVLTSLIRY